MRETMRDIADRLLPGAIVTDTGSTKAQVLRWADEILPRTINFVGGHPMAGKTEVGAAHAEATLFEGARWVLVPSRDASAAAVETIAGLATALGAHPMYMDAEEHDAYVAAVSHLPLFAASALFRVARDSEAWPELSLLAANGLPRHDAPRRQRRGAGPRHRDPPTATSSSTGCSAIAASSTTSRTCSGTPIAKRTCCASLTQLNFDYLGFLDGQLGRVETDQKSLARLRLDQRLPARRHHLRAPAKADRPPR